MATLAELEALLALAKAGTLKPLVLIFGDQDYLVRQAYDRLLEALVAEDLRAFNLEQMDGARAEVQGLLDSLATPPMLAGAKAIGVFDARFFQSKANLSEVLGKAKEKWEAGDASGGLRQLGRAVSLAGWTWEEAAQASSSGWAEALGAGEAEAARLTGAWLGQALAQAISAGLTAPTAGDDSGALAEGLEALLKDGGIPGTTLICAATSADARKRLFKLFHEQGHVLDFKTAEKGPQANLTARAFLAQALKQRGLTLKPSVGERLAANFGSDLGLLDQELSKLESYAYPRKDIQESDLAAVSVARPDENVFQLVNALGKRDLGGSLGLLRQFLAADPEAKFQIFGLLTNEVRKLLLLRALMDEGKLSSKPSGDYNNFKMQVHPRLAKDLPPALAALWRRTNAYALFQTLGRARAFEQAQLRQLLAGLALSDLSLKTGQADPEGVLEELCLRLCGVREEAVL